MTRLRTAVIVVALALVAAGIPAGPAAADQLPPLRHVFIIVLENKGFDETFGFQSPAPYLSLTLPSMGALLPNYYGVTHESLGNYIALVSGQGSNPVTQADCQIFVDVLPGTIGANGQASGVGCVYPSAVKTIADQMSAAGLTWKGYMQDMANAPGQAATCRHPTIGTPDGSQSAKPGDAYATRHNPFVYFHSLLDSGACSKYDVPLSQLPGDLASIATTPNYSFITPNLCSDGHDATCAGGGAGGLTGINQFLQAWVPMILSSPAYQADGLLAIVFDESDGSDATACCGEPQFPNTPNNGGPNPGPGGGRTGAVLLSPFIDPGTVDDTPYNHFTLLRSIEDLFGLGHLGFAALPGLQSLGSDAFTCFAPAPTAHHGKLPAGSEIKLAVIGQGTASRPMVEIKLWHPGRVIVQVPRRTHHRSHSRRRGHRHRHRHRLRTIARVRGGACQLLSVKLPARHGKVVVTASAFGGSERRTLTY